MVTHTSVWKRKDRGGYQVFIKILQALVFMSNNAPTCPPTQGSRWYRCIQNKISQNGPSTRLLCNFYGECYYNLPGTALVARTQTYWYEYRGLAFSVEPFRIPGVM